MDNLIKADAAYIARLLAESHQPVKNRDLWCRIKQGIVKHRGPVEFNWVTGDAGHPGNEMADQLAD